MNKPRKHKVITVQRGYDDHGRDTYAARCEDCDAITFGGFARRSDARAALAGHEEGPDLLQQVEADDSTPQEGTTLMSHPTDNTTTICTSGYHWCDPDRCEDGYHAKVAWIPRGDVVDHVLLSVVDTPGRDAQGPSVYFELPPIQLEPSDADDRIKDVIQFLDGCRAELLKFVDVVEAGR